MEQRNSSEITPPATTVRVVAEIRTDYDTATDMQEKLTSFIRSLGGVAAEITVERSDLLPETELDQKLSTSIEEAFNNTRLDPYISNRTKNSLRRAGLGLQTLRDILVIGKDRIHDIRNVGYGSLDAIDEVLKENIGKDVAWKDTPTINDIAGLCTRLDQVTIHALDPLSRMSRTLSNAGLLSSTIQDLLDMPYEKILEATREREYKYDSDQYEYSAPNKREADLWLAQAREFRRQFIAAKAALKA